MVKTSKTHQKKPTTQKIKKMSFTDPTKSRGMNPGACEGHVVPASYKFTSPPIYTYSKK